MNPFTILNILRAYRTLRHIKNYNEEPEPLSRFGYWYFRIMGGLIIGLLLIGLIAVLYTGFNQPGYSVIPSTNPAALPPPAPTPLISAEYPGPNNPITLTLTWDEWTDLVNALAYINGTINTAFDLAPTATLPLSTTAEARATLDRLQALGDKLDRAAQSSSDNLSYDELDHILTHQLQRTEQFVDLMTAILKVKFEYLLSAFDQEKQKP